MCGGHSAPEVAFLKDPGMPHHVPGALVPCPAIPMSVVHFGSCAALTGLPQPFKLSCTRHLTSASHEGGAISMSDFDTR